MTVSTQLAGVGYTSNFIFDMNQILNSVVRWGGWLLRDYTWIIPLFITTVSFYVIRRLWNRFYWWLANGVWMVGWLIIYLPWYFAVEYYLLPFAAGVALLAGNLAAESIDMIHHSQKAWRAFSLLSIGLSGLLFLGSQSNNIASAAVQLAQDSVNAQTLAFIAQEAPYGSAVVVNIQLANEYVEQMQIMLSDFYDRPDLIFSHYQNQDLGLMARQYPTVFLLIPDLENQPAMTVRMGLVEENQKKWNSDLLSALNPNTWQIASRFSKEYPVLTVNYPKLLCAILYRENYCTKTSRLMDFRPFRYQWTIYRSR